MDTFDTFESNNVHNCVNVLIDDFLVQDKKYFKVWSPNKKYRCGTACEGSKFNTGIASSRFLLTSISALLC